MKQRIGACLGVVLVFAAGFGCSSFGSGDDVTPDTSGWDVPIFLDTGADQGAIDVFDDARPDFAVDAADASDTDGFGDGDVNVSDPGADLDVFDLPDDGSVEPDQPDMELPPVDVEQQDVRPDSDDPDSVDDDGTTPDDSGWDANGAHIAVDVGPEGIAFGQVIPGCPPEPRVVRVENDGNGTLSIQGIAFQEDGAGLFALTGLPAEFPVLLEPGAYLEFGVSFTPAAAGAYSITLSIVNDSTNDPDMVIAVAGTSANCGAGTHKCGCNCLSDSALESCGSRCAPCTTAVVGAEPVCAPSGLTFSCGFECLDGYHQCASSCKLDNDPNACGPACTLCYAKANSTRACIDGTCALACNDGWDNCDGVYNTGCEESLDTTANCGVCDNVCISAPSHGFPVCENRQCAFECNSGYHRDGTRCVQNNVDWCCGDDGPAGACVDCRQMTNPMPPNTTGVCTGLVEFSCDMVCEDGWISTSGGVNDGCECHFVSDFDQPGNGIDEDCDSSDGRPDLAWYVSTTGSDSADGSAGAPFRTIQKAVNSAKAVFLRKRIFIAAGQYDENVVIDGSISLYGGLSTDGNWRYSPSNVTTIRATSPVGGRIIAIDGSNMTDETWIGNVTIVAGPDVQGTDGSDVYGVKCTNCTALNLYRVNIQAGPGGDVTVVPVAAAGANGGAGGIGGYYDIPGAAGTSACGRTGGLGGQGGWGSTGWDGAPGVVIGAGGGAGGDGGWYSLVGAGVAGQSCTDLSSGGGGAQTVGVVSGGYWAGTAGTTGGDGCHGHGGGGGGGAMGTSGSDYSESGAGGGGGGGGGCGGAGGPGGKAGGASLGVFLDQSTGATISECVISASDAGDGGVGVVGGVGGQGGAGGPARSGESGYMSGAGGAGGNGMPGGKGGGGAGGISFAVYLSGTSIVLPGSNSLAHGQPGIGGSTLGNKNAVDGISGDFN